MLQSKGIYALKKMHVKIKKSWWTRDGKKKDEFIMNDVNK